MSKFTTKLQPPKNFEYTFFFGAKILQGDVAFISSSIGPLAIEHE